MADVFLLSRLGPLIEDMEKARQLAEESEANEEVQGLIEGALTMLRLAWDRAERS